MFKKLFFKDVEEDDEVFETVDPVVEQRRKEKFSTPLIYDEEKEEVKEVKEKKPVKKEGEKKEKKPYEMTQIISPIKGLKKSKVDELSTPKPVKKKPKKRKMEDQLVPVISPFYGPADFVVEEQPEPQIIKKAKPPVKEETVEDNLRNIANIIEEEKDQLRIIEERTGEFKLDFSNQNEGTLIDEIDDSMSLDELMSLYEKKFKD